MESLKELYLSENIRLGWNWLRVTNALAYYQTKLIASIKSFIVQAPNPVWRHSVISCCGKQSRDKVSHLQKRLAYFANALSSSRDFITEGKAQYHWPPCSNLFRSVTFSIENSDYLPFTKQATLMRRPTVLSLPLQLVFPG